MEFYDFTLGEPELYDQKNLMFNDTPAHISLENCSNITFNDCFIEKLTITGKCKNITFNDCYIFTMDIVNDKNKNIIFNECEMDGIDEEIEGFTYNNDY